MHARPAVFLIFVVWVFSIATLIRAAHSLFWYDELLTWHISALPHFSDVWGALRAGIDLNPPFEYLLVRVAHLIFGVGPVSTRLPMILGMLVMSASVFLYLRRRVHVSLAFAGMLLPWTTDAYRFALNARPYGILLGTGGMVLLCWSRAAESPRRWRELFGLGVGLAAALLTHVYAILLFVPLAIGELVRLYQRRRPDWPMWITMLVCATPVLLYPILMAHTGRVQASSLLRPDIWSVPEIYSALLRPLFWPVILGGVLFVVLAYQPRPAERGGRPALPKYEWAALSCFAAIPALSVVVAALTTGSASLRYGVLGVIGIACLIPVVVALAGVQAARLGAALTMLLMLFFGGQFASQLWWATRGYGVELFHFLPASQGVVQAASPTPATTLTGEAVPGHSLLAALPPNDEPLAISSGLAFLEIEHYASPGLMSRAYYLTDSAAAIRHTGVDRFETTYPKMKELLHLRGNIADAKSFLAEHRSFLIYSAGYLVEWRVPDEWLLPELRDQGWRIRTIAREGRAVLAEVSAP